MAPSSRSLALDPKPERGSTGPLESSGYLNHRFIWPNQEKVYISNKQFGAKNWRKRSHMISHSSICTVIFWEATMDLSKTRFKIVINCASSVSSWSYPPVNSPSLLVYPLKLHALHYIALLYLKLHYITLLTSVYICKWIYIYIYVYKDR